MSSLMSSSVLFVALKYKYNSVLLVVGLDTDTTSVSVVVVELCLLTVPGPKSQVSNSKSGSITGSGAMLSLLATIHNGTKIST